MIISGAASICASDTTPEDNNAYVERFLAKDRATLETVTAKIQKIEYVINNHSALIASLHLNTRNELTKLKARQDQLARNIEDFEAYLNNENLCLTELQRFQNL